MKRVGIYLRISTDSQTTENQRRELEAVAARSGWQVAGDRSVACSIDRDSQHLLGSCAGVMGLEKQTKLVIDRIGSTAIRANGH